MGGTGAWSHAGGVVARDAGGEVEYLLVAASDNPDVWVLPKGRIEIGESPEQAAVREIMEEAGVRALAGAELGENEYQAKGKTVRCVFFVMRYQGETERTEPRAVAWRRYEDAVALLYFENNRQILARADGLLKGE